MQIEILIWDVCTKPISKADVHQHTLCKYFSNLLKFICQNCNYGSWGIQKFQKIK